jgi:hypothetical protein
MRKAPTSHAADHKNVIIKGIDGSYISTPDKNNVYKWIKLKSY